MGDPPQEAFRPRGVEGGDRLGHGPDHVAAGPLGGIRGDQGLGSLGVEPAQRCGQSLGPLGPPGGGIDGPHQRARLLDRPPGLVRNAEIGQAAAEVDQEAELHVGVGLGPGLGQPRHRRGELRPSRGGGQRVVPGFVAIRAVEGRLDLGQHRRRRLGGGSEGGLEHPDPGRVAVVGLLARLDAVPGGLRVDPGECIEQPGLGLTVRTRQDAIDVRGDQVAGQRPGLGP